MQRMYRAIASSILLLAAPAATAAEKADEVNVEGYEQLQAGEHPRLIFRASDVTALRQRANTPEGEAILTRCRKMLENRFTTWNAAGWAFLYQVTGQQDYADRARETAEAMMAGKGNPDGRYRYADPGGQLRAGPVLAAMGLAYDMAHDGWDEAFRAKVTKSILDHPYASQIANHPRHHPGVNHWGAHSGGLGTAMLAILDDPALSADQRARAEDYFAKALRNVKRELAEGFSDRAYYYEGHYCGRLSANTGVIPFLQAYKVAKGVDLTKQYESAYWLAPKWIYELVRSDSGKVRNLQRGMYQRDPFTRGRMLSSDGDFAQGFGICPEKLRPALLWTYNHIVEPDKSSRTYDIQEYPHLAAYALANWPLETEPRNPGELLPNVLEDTEAGYFLFRSSWTGTGRDIVVSALTGAAGDRGRGCAQSGSVLILADNERYEFPGMFHRSEPVHVKLDKGAPAGVISARRAENTRLHKKAPEGAGKVLAGTTSLFVDLAGKGDVGGLVVMAGPQAGFVSFDCRGSTPWGGRKAGWHNAHSVLAPRSKMPPATFEALSTPVKELKAPKGMKTWLVKSQNYAFAVTVIGGEPTAPEVSGDAMTVIGRTIRFDGEKLSER